MLFHIRQSGVTPTFCLLRFHKKKTSYSGRGLGYITLLLSLYGLLLGFSGCKDQPERQKENKQPIQSIDLKAVTAKLAQIDSLEKDPFQKIAYLEQYYKDLSLPLKVHFSQDIFRRIFNVAYRSPDSTVLPFYKAQFQVHQEQPKIQVASLIAQATYFLFINQQPDSGMAAIQALKPYQANFNDTTKKSYYSLLAQVFYQKGDFQKAADNYLKTIKLAEKIKDSSSLISSYGNLSNIYSSMDEEEKALPLKKSTLAYFIRQQNDDYAFIGEISLARTYANLKQMDSAFVHYNKALALKQKGVNNPSVEFILYTNLGEIYYERGDLKKALSFFDLCKAPLAAIGTEDQRLMYVIYSTPAYNEVKADISAEIADIKKAITLFSDQNNLILVKAAYLNLYLVLDKRGQYKQALQYYKSYDSVSNILSSQDNNKFITKLRTQYELQKKQTTIIRQQQVITKKTAYNRLLGVLLITGLALFGFIFTYGRLRRKKKEAALQRQFSTELIARGEDERSRLARDLHDGLGQNILLLKHQVKEGERIEVENIDNLLEEVRAISRNVHPIMLDQIGFKESVHHICRQLSEKESLFISTDLAYNGELGKDKELQLFRIFQEGLNNVIKYAQAHAANIQTMVEGSDFIAVIRDNGKGFDVTSTLNSGASFGLFSILERSRAINGKATIHSGASGTLIKIKIPIDV